MIKKLVFGEQYVSDFFCCCNLRHSQVESGRGL